MDEFVFDYGNYWYTFPKKIFQTLKKSHYLHLKFANYLVGLV